MTQASSVGLRLRSGRLPWPPALVALSALGLVLSVPAAAQEQDPSANAGLSSEPCRVFATDGAEGEAKRLWANCRGRGVILGPVTRFQAIVNEGLQATLVDTRFGSEQRVLLLSIQDDGQPLVEDLSGQIALAAGRGPLSEITGLEIDLGGFAEGGRLSVRADPQAASQQAAQLDLGRQIAAERARRPASAK
jgi:hypothetical protein